MPIKDLTKDAPASPRQGYPLIARLYKGDEKPEAGNRPGRDLKHFRVEFEAGYEALEDDWLRMYGQEPAVFSSVFLAAPTVDDAFPTWLEEWTATTMLHRCDGDEQHRWYNQDHGLYMDARIKCAAPACKCQRIGRLNLIFSDFVQATGIMGTIQLSTHSINDIITIHPYLANIERMAGTLLGVPFTVGRAERLVSTPASEKGGKRRMTTKSLLYIHVEPDYARTTLLPLLTRQAAPELPSGPQRDVAADRARLGNGGSRRIGAGGVTDYPEPVQSADAVEEAQILEGDEPAAAIVPQGPPWKQGEAKLFMQAWEVEGVTAADVRQALGITRWDEWQGSVAEANDAVNRFIDARVAAERASQAS